MEVALILGGVAVLYLLLENRNASISAGISSNQAASGSPNYLSGLVNFGPGAPAFGSGPSSGQKITQEVGAGIGAGVATLGVLGAGSASGIGLFGGAAAAGTALGAAIPIIGTLAVVAIGVISAIEKHHQEAIANEGHALNQNDPIAIGDFTLVVQAAKAGQINYQTAQQYVDQIVADWYLSVRSVQKGHWAYQGSDLNVTYANSYANRSGPYGSSSKNPDSHAPDPCNGACVVGHYFIERGAQLTLMAVQAIQAGQHGTVTYPVIPPHDAQSGLPAKTVSF
jgi:hypothetical protein